MTNLPAERSGERGIALPLALFALVIMGALVSTAFIVARNDRLGSSTTRRATAAENAAESGLVNMYATWDPTIHSVMGIWNGTPATEWTGGFQLLGGNSRLRYVDSLRRLNNNLFLVRSIGQRLDADGNVIAQLGLAQYFRLVKPTVGVNAAITVQDPVSFNGNAFLVNGMNGLPSQWNSAECPPLDAGNSDDVVGVRSSTGTGVQAADYDNVFGFPARDAPNDPTITSATFQNFLDYTYATLGAQPGVKILAATTPYNNIAPLIDVSTLPWSCDRSTTGTSVIINLGEPWRNPPTVGAVAQCYNYFPVVHGTGSSTKFAAGTRGQGTLLIDGDLELAGGFEWAGLILIRGKMKINGTGNKISGAVLAEGVDLLTAGTISGNVDVQYSKCAIDRAVGGATLARPLGQRSWAHTY